MEIIPAILAKDYAEIQQKIKQIESFCSWAQIDIVDGIFAKNKTWNSPRELNGIKTGLDLEVHLMAADAKSEVDKWLASPVKRIIFHFEKTAENGGDNGVIAGDIIQKIKDAGKEAGMAINPQTTWRVLEPCLDRLDFVLFLSVNPGFYGSPFDESVIHKIKSFYQEHKDVIIAADGGITPENAPKLVSAGVSRLCVGSYIFKSDNIGQAIEYFKQNL